jgi:trigger factor
MKVTVSESKGLKTNLNVLVKKQEIDKKIEERVIELQKTVNIKGFRPGKAPVDLLKNNLLKHCTEKFWKKFYRTILIKH